MTRTRFALGTVVLALALPGALRAEDMPFTVESNLRAAVAKVDITPPAGTKVTGHVRATDGLRDRLHAGEESGVRSYAVALFRRSTAQKPRKSWPPARNHGAGGSTNT